MRILLLSVLLGACGSSQPAAETTPPPKADEHEGHEEHGDMPAEVQAFHDVLAPLWHAPEGAERTAKTCDSTGALEEKAVAIEAVWKTEGKELHDSVKALAEECARDGRPEFQTRFAAVHTAFHALAERH